MLNRTRRFLSTSLLTTLLLGSGTALATEPQVQPQPQAGPYVYGEAAVAAQNGATYVVMQRHQEQWLGAIYQPNAEFDCFVGQMQAQQLALRIQDPATTETFTHTLAMAPQPPIASQTGRATTPQLVGFAQLNQLTEQDHQLLTICQQRLDDSTKSPKQL
ncbi:MAG: hypothetical protein AAGG51_28375 [Cyanobacteria bacterium P01_G01_bin.54]